MKIKILFLSFFVFSQTASAEDLTDRIKVGATQAEIVALMGERPYDTNCSTTLGVKSCKLSWKKATFDKNSFIATFYEITLIADHVISTNTFTRQGVFK